MDPKLAEAVAEVEERLLSRRTVEDMTDLSATTIWREVVAGRFPAPVPISRSRKAFVKREVEEWIKDKIQAARKRPAVGGDPTSWNTVRRR